jgi:hypothetical protein
MRTVAVNSVGMKERGINTNLHKTARSENS